MFELLDLPRHKDFRFPKSLTSCAIWPFHRFALSVADVEEHLAECGKALVPDTDEHSHKRLYKRTENSGRPTRKRNKIFDCIG